MAVLLTQQPHAGHVESPRSTCFICGNKQSVSVRAGVTFFFFLDVATVYAITRPGPLNHSIHDDAAAREVDDLTSYRLPIAGSYQVPNKQPSRILDPTSL